VPLDQRLAPPGASTYPTVHTSFPVAPAAPPGCVLSWGTNPVILRLVTTTGSAQELLLAAARQADDDLWNRRRSVAELRAARRLAILEALRAAVPTEELARVLGLLPADVERIAVAATAY
jgi:hypothetical protein